MIMNLHISFGKSRVHYRVLCTADCCFLRMNDDNAMHICTTKQDHYLVLFFFFLYNQQQKQRNKTNKQTNKQTKEASKGNEQDTCKKKKQSRTSTV